MQVIVNNLLDFSYQTSPRLQSPCVYLKKIGSFARNCLIKIIQDVALTLLILPGLKYLPPIKNFVSYPILGTIYKHLTLPTIRIRRYVTNFFPAIHAHSNSFCKPINYTELFIGGILEECLFRVAIQEVLLRQIPKGIIKKIAPDHENLVDHRITKIARVILTASLFALCHGFELANLHGCLLPQFVGGVLYGYWYEKGATVVQLSLCHFGYNAVIFSLFRHSY